MNEQGTMGSPMAFNTVDYYKTGKLTPSGEMQGLTNMRDFYKSYPHEINMVLGIATAFIPLVGPFISAGIGFADAKQYYDENDKKTAGMVAMFSLLPGVGSVVSKIPGIKQLGSKGMTKLAVLFSKGGQLSKVEGEVVKGIMQNSELVAQAAKTQAASLSARIATGAKKLAVSGAKTIAPYAAAGVAYSKTYDKLNANTPQVKAEKEGYQWNFVKEAFGSSGTEQENNLLNQAWAKGWRPGQVVPQGLQTKRYQENYKKEQEDLMALNNLISQIK